MLATTADEAISTLHVSKSVQIAAPIQIAFEAVLEELGPEGQMPDGKPFPMKIEPWPGGRWYRDLGNNAGHFWGHRRSSSRPPCWKSAAHCSCHTRRSRTCSIG